MEPLTDNTIPTFPALDNPNKYVTVDAMAGIWLKDVAKAAGVSVSAASHAVNGTGTLAAATRTKILAAAERIGYRRNPHLSAIAARRFRAAGSFTPVAYLSFFEGDARYQFPGPLRPSAFQEELQKLGMELVESGNYLEAKTARRMLDQLYARGVEAIFLGNVNRGDLLAALDLDRFCVLGLGDIPGGAGLHRLEVNWIHAVRHGFRHLHQAGCRRIGAIFPSQSPLSNQDRLRIGAYRGEVEQFETKAGLPIFRNLAAPGLLAWYKKVRPDGVIVHGLPMIYHLIEAGVDIPGTVKAVQILRTREADAWSAPFPGSVVDAAQLQLTAARMLYDMVTHGESGRPAMARTVFCQTGWVE